MMAKEHRLETANRPLARKTEIHHRRLSELAGIRAVRLQRLHTATKFSESRDRTDETHHLRQLGQEDYGQRKAIQKMVTSRTKTRPDDRSEPAGFQS